MTISEETDNCSFPTPGGTSSRTPAPGSRAACPASVSGMMQRPGVGWGRYGVSRLPANPVQRGLLHSFRNGSIF